MKLPMPTAKEIYDMADRAAAYLGSTRSVNTLIIENAIRSALAIVIDRMEIQIPQPIGLDLSKAPQ
jgi:uncharacterized protein (DUF1778 family)